MLVRSDILNIKKRYKKEKSLIKRNSFIIIFIMLLIPYMVVVLNDEGVFKGLEFDFALIYATIIDVLMLAYIVKIINDNKLTFQMVGRKLKIRRGLFSLPFSIPVDKAIYVDIIENKNQKFETIIIMKKGKKNKNFDAFNIGFVKSRIQYKGVYEYLNRNNQSVDYNCIIISSGGTKKFYLLYTLFKNAYNAEFSSKALDYIKKFMEEYNMS